MQRFFNYRESYTWFIHNETVKPKDVHCGKSYFNTSRWENFMHSSLQFDLIKALPLAQVSVKRNQI